MISKGSKERYKEWSHPKEEHRITVKLRVMASQASNAGMITTN